MAIPLTHFVGGDPALSNSDSVNTNQAGINSLLVFDMPMEIGWKIGELPVRIFGDFAVNFEADDRAKAAGFPAKATSVTPIKLGRASGNLKPSMIGNCRPSGSTRSNFHSIQTWLTPTSSIAG